MYSPTDHIPDEQLVDLIERRLTPAAEAPLRQHLAGCTGCAHRLSRMERVVALLRSTALEDAPAEVQARAAGLLSAHAAPDRPSLRRRVLATLRFDSAQRPLILGARSGQPGARQLLFLAAGHELDLRIAQADALWAVTGQLLGPEDAGEVTLYGSTATWSVTLNEIGEFTLPPVPAGSYVLSVRAADLEIEVPDMTVGYSV
ncbi:MAG TPA: hypothetical protein VHB98_14240 [Chloroflexota bacterium]|nr:hypothetical protein [Chloroflexota bacterium]